MLLPLLMFIAATLAMMPKPTDRHYNSTNDGKEIQMACSSFYISCQIIEENKHAWPPAQCCELSVSLWAALTVVLQLQLETMLKFCLERNVCRNAMLKHWITLAHGHNRCTP